MPRICFVLVAGLDRALLSRAPALPLMGQLSAQAAYKPAFPAVTCTAQATLTTGVLPDQHGIIANGLYTHGQPELHHHLDLSSHADARVTVSFWEQSNSLLQFPRFWHAPHFPEKKTAMLFWQNSMPKPGTNQAAADIVLTPKPHHTADGRTLTACWSAPADLYATLTQQLGPFPLHNYWSPMAGLPSSQWIARAAEYVWQHHAPDLQLVYIPHLDFNLLRLGPSNPAILQDLSALDALLAPLAARVHADGGTFLVAGDYGMNDVTTPILPNLALRQGGLLKTKLDTGGKLLVDYAASDAFVMADHQVAFAHIRPGREEETLRILTALPGVERAFRQKSDLERLGLGTPRAGAAVLTAAPTAWFAHDWWEPGAGDAEKPAWQFSVDIHNKPGFDPRELFFDPVKKCIAQNPALPKGSHGLTDDTQRWPVVLSKSPIPGFAGDGLSATSLAPALSRLLTS